MKDNLPDKDPQRLLETYLSGLYGNNYILQYIKFGSESPLILHWKERQYYRIFKLIMGAPLSYQISEIDIDLDET
jgi:hypothetical protein